MTDDQGQDSKPAKGQMEFNYARGDRRNMVDYIRIPSFSYVNSRGRRVFVDSTKSMRLLLMAIEDYCGKTPDRGWPLYLEEIADKMGQEKNQNGKVDTRTASRAVSACCAAGLLIVHRGEKNTSRSRYQIDWDKVRDVLRGNPETAKWAVEEAEKEAATPHDKSQTPHDKLSSPHDKMSLGHDKMSLGGANHTLSSRARALNHDSNQNTNPSWGNQPQNRYAKYAGWPFKIELPHLKASESIERLWKAALSRSDVELDELLDRVKFFALARYVARLSQIGEIVNPGGYFHAQLVRPDRRPNWLGDAKDYEFANKSIAYVDCSYREAQSIRTAREGH